MITVYEIIATLEDTRKKVFTSDKIRADHFLFGLVLQSKADFSYKKYQMSEEQFKKELLENSGTLEIVE